MNRECHNIAGRYSELLSRHESMLRRRCLIHAHGNPELADDYFQEVALSLWRHLPLIESDIPLQQERAYVKEALRFVIGHCNRRKRPDLQMLRMEMIVAFGQYDRDDEMSLNSLVDSLPEDERLVVGLYRTGYSPSEIAQFLGISPNTVSQRLHRAVVRMRALYEQECEKIK